ncbi:hypothetical protein ZWY2020_034124 [Hordeum vulgare]|nr:hypothetical protein ZWY2020_034124 [Hordeum vulgare]
MNRTVAGRQGGAHGGTAAAEAGAFPSRAPYSARQQSRDAPARPPARQRGVRGPRPLRLVERARWHGPGPLDRPQLARKAIQRLGTHRGDGKGRKGKETEEAAGALFAAAPANSALLCTTQPPRF